MGLLLGNVGMGDLCEGEGRVWESGEGEGEYGCGVKKRLRPGNLLGTRALPKLLRSNNCAAFPLTQIPRA